MLMKATPKKVVIQMQKSNLIVNLEEFDNLFIIDESKRGRYDNSRECSEKGVTKERSQEQECQRHKDCHHCV